jgi:hypothetical protein
MARIVRRTATEPSAFVIDGKEPFPDIRSF